MSKTEYNLKEWRLCVISLIKNKFIYIPLIVSSFIHYNFKKIRAADEKSFIL